MYTQLARSGWGRASWDRQKAGVTHCTLVIWLGGIHKPKGARVSVSQFSIPSEILNWGGDQCKGKHFFLAWGALDCVERG